MVVSYYLQQQQEDNIEEEERNETLHQTKLSIIIFSFGYRHGITTIIISFQEDFFQNSFNTSAGFVFKILLTISSM